MQYVFIILFAVAILYCALYVETNPVDTSPELTRFTEDISFCKEISEKYYDRVRTHIDNFLKAYHNTFVKANCTEDLYMSLFEYKTKVANAFMELKGCLPNDLDLESRLETSNKNIAYIFKVYIEDARIRCKFPNYVNEPVNDYYYGKHVLAVNDVIV